MRIPDLLEEPSAGVVRVGYSQNVLQTACKSLLQRVSRKSVLQVFLTRVSHKGVTQMCLTRVSTRRQVERLQTHVDTKIQNNNRTYCICNVSKRSRAIRRLVFGS